MTGDALTLVMLAVVFVLLIVIFFIPTERRIQRRKIKRAERMEEQRSKDWQAAALRLERHVQGLKGEIRKWENKDKVQERQLTVERQKYAQLQERLAQERSWKDREVQDQEKKTREILTLKEHLREVQHSLEEEHGQFLRLQGEARELKTEVAGLQDQRRSLEDHLAKAKARVEAQAQEIGRLKEEIARLAQKKEDEEWVTKTEYEKLAHQLRIRDNELSRLKKQFPMDD